MSLAPPFVTAKFFVDASGFRNDQLDDDVFEVYFGHDPFWLNEAEVVVLRDRLQAALDARAAVLPLLKPSPEESAGAARPMLDSRPGAASEKA